MSELTTPQIVTKYNQLAAELELSPVKRFTDRKTAERRLATLTTMYSEKFPVVVVEEEPVVEAPKKNVLTGRGRKSQFDLTKKLVVNIDPTRPTNPKHKNSRAYTIFEMYGNIPDLTGEKFVAAVVAAGYPRRLALATLHWDMEHGFIHFADFAA